MLISGKVEVMPLRCDAGRRKPDGSTLVSKTSMVYPGSIVTTSGDMAAQIADDWKQPGQIL